MKCKDFVNIVSLQSEQWAMETSCDFCLYNSGESCKKVIEEREKQDREIRELYPLLNDVLKDRDWKFYDVEDFEITYIDDLGIHIVYNSNIRCVDFDFYFGQNKFKICNYHWVDIRRKDLVMQFYNKMRKYATLLNSFDM